MKIIYAKKTLKFYMTFCHVINIVTREDTLCFLYIKTFYANFLLKFFILFLHRFLWTITHEWTKLDAPRSSCAYLKNMLEINRAFFYLYIAGVTSCIKYIININTLMIQSCKDKFVVKVDELTVRKFKD